MNIEVVKQRVIDAGYIPLFNECHKSTDKLLCRAQEGYLGYLNNCGLMRGDKMSIVHHTNPYTIYNIKTYITNRQLGCELITQEWVSHDTHLVLRCPKCQNNYECLWTTLRHKPDGLCPDCVINKLTDGKRNDINVIKNAFIERGYQPLFNTYTSNTDKLLVKDDFGYLGLMLYKQLLQNRGFYPFHSANPYTIQNIKWYLESNGSSCKLITTEYKNNTDLMEFECGCSQKYYASLTSIKRKNGLRCDLCTQSMSNLEYMVKQWLDEQKYQYKTQCRFTDCRNIYPLPFDFKLDLNNQTYVIEVNGSQHYKPHEYFGGEDAFLYRCNNDNIKKEYCHANNIIYIELPYKEFKNEKYIETLKNNLSQTH